MEEWKRGEMKNVYFAYMFEMICTEERYTILHIDLCGGWHSGNGIHTHPHQYARIYTKRYGYAFVCLFVWFYPPFDWYSRNHNDVNIKYHVYCICVMDVWFIAHSIAHLFALLCLWEMRACHLSCNWTLNGGFSEWLHFVVVFPYWSFIFSPSFFFMIISWFVNEMRAKFSIYIQKYTAQTTTVRIRTIFIPKRGRKSKSDIRLK